MVSLKLKEILQLEALQMDLRDQFQRMTTTWDDRKTDPAAELVFSEVEKWIDIAKRAVNKALCNSDTFLEAQEAWRNKLGRGFRGWGGPVSDQAVIGCRESKDIPGTLAKRDVVEDTNGPALHMAGGANGADCEPKTLSQEALQLAIQKIEGSWTTSQRRMAQDFGEFLRQKPGNDLPGCDTPNRDSESGKNGGATGRC